MLTVAQVAERLNISRTTVRRLRGAIGGIVIGEKCLRFPEEALERYIKKCQSARTKMRREESVLPSSSSRGEVVFSDGSRPARRKSRRNNLKLVSSTS